MNFTLMDLLDKIEISHVRIFKKLCNFDILNEDQNISFIVIVLLIIRSRRSIIGILVQLTEEEFESDQLIEIELYIQIDHINLSSFSVSNQDVQCMALFFYYQFMLIGLHYEYQRIIRNSHTFYEFSTSLLLLSSSSRYGEDGKDCEITL